MDAPVDRMPPELLDMVLNQLAAVDGFEFAGRRYLLQCSNVSMRWRIRSLYILLNSVSFKLNPHTPEAAEFTSEVQTHRLDTFLAILDRYAGLSNAVSTVHFKFGDKKNALAKEFFPRLLEVLPERCRSIKTLLVQDADAAKVWRTSELFSRLRQFTEVDTVKFHACALRAVDLHIFGSALPQLSHLGIGSQFVVDRRQSSRHGEKAQYTVNSLLVQFNWRIGKPRDLFGFLQDSPFRNITMLSIIMTGAFQHRINSFGAYIASLGPVLKYLYVRCSISSTLDGHVDLVQDLGLDLLKNSSLQALILFVENLSPNSLVAVMKSITSMTLRYVMLRAPELNEDMLRSGFAAVQESLPQSVNELCIFDPFMQNDFRLMKRQSGYGLRNNWEDTIKEVFAPAIQRGVNIQMLTLTKTTSGQEEKLVEEWRKRCTL